MSNYVIFTDSACDIKPELLKKWDVQSISMTFRFEDEDREYSNEDIQSKAFYDRMRNGGIAKTAAINPERFTEAFEAILQQGNDILYLGFSSGLSTTFNSARIAAEELLPKYPDRKILAVDSLAASAGQGLFVYMVVEQKKKGLSIEEAAAYAEGIKLNVCHWFTVDDLVYLKRGGRISPTAAFVGNMLGIKPVLHVDNEGHLVNVMKVRGRKAALNTIADKYGELVRMHGEGSVFLSHGDCEGDAKELASIIKSKYHVSVDVTTDIGPVIGAHSGPGTIALFFVGNER